MKIAFFYKVSKSISIYFSSSLLLSIIYCFYSLSYKKVHEKIIEHDTINYYAFVPGLVIESDLSFNFPALLTVAGRYYWQRFGINNLLKTYNNNQLMYYNAQIFFPDGFKPADRKFIDMCEEVGRTDVFLLIQTEANMYRFGFGIIDEHYNLITES